MLRNTFTLLRAAAPKPTIVNATPRLVPRLYSTQGGAEASASTTAETLNKEADKGASEAASSSSSSTSNDAAATDAKVADLTKQLEEKNKMVAELKDARLRSLADFENLQKISQREKTQAKDFALTSFAKDLVRSVDIVSLALKSVQESSLSGNKELAQLHEGVTLTKKEIENVLRRHGVTPFDPTGQQFDPNKHEALFQAPVPGKEPGSVLECQEIGYMIKDRLLRPAKVGVVLAQE